MRFERSAFVSLLIFATLSLGSDRADARASSVIQLLKDPAALIRGPESPLHARVRALVSRFAPRVWLHARENERPIDPLRFIQAASLWKQDTWIQNQRVIERGAIDPAILNSGEWGAHFLKIEGKIEDSASAPVLWRLGEVISPTRILLEYWYHYAYSKAGKFGLGDHQGDWEGMSVVVELDPSAGEADRPIALFLAAHEGGAWHCASKLGWVQDTQGQLHPEVFAALGTHATYPSPGIFRTSCLIDRTGRGQAWDSWNQMRPLALEPYYGYSGAWGDVSWIPYMTGPRAPGPKKAIPRFDRVDRIPAGVMSSCELQPDESADPKRPDLRARFF